MRGDTRSKKRNPGPSGPGGCQTQVFVFQDFGSSGGVAVTLTEDGAGEYRALLPRGAARPTIVTHAGIFRMSVPMYLAALGEVVSVRVTPMA